MTLLPPESKTNGGSTPSVSEEGGGSTDSSWDQTRPNPTAGGLTPLPAVATMRPPPSPCGFAFGEGRFGLRFLGKEGSACASGEGRGVTLLPPESKTYGGSTSGWKPEGRGEV